MAQINQKAVKCLSKLICAGFDTEKAVLTMTMDEILSIPGITVAEISLRSQKSKQQKGEVLEMAYDDAKTERYPEIRWAGKGRAELWRRNMI